MMKNLRFKRILSLSAALLFVLMGGGINLMAYTTNYNEVDVNGNTIYYYVGGYTGNWYAYVTYATTSYNSYSGNVVIPQTVTTNDKTYTVKYIDESAFKNSTGLTSVTLPSSIIQISKNAFEGCSGLTTINLGETSVTSIGNYVFKGCTSLESITIPATATSLGTYVFNGCTSLESITLPSAVTSIGSNAFEGCTSLETVTINSDLTSIPASLFKGCTSLSSVNIPSTVTTINGSAFYNCSSLTSINIPSGVTSILSQAFYGCTSLANVSYNATSCGDFSSAVFSASTADLFTVTIGDNVTRLPNNVFNGLTHLTSITIPSSVVSIGNFAFYNCTGLTSINMSSSVESIGNSAFYCCSGLTSIALPSTLLSIGNYAFQYCSGLTEITIPSSVTTMGTSAFNNCSGLTEITYNAIELSNFTSSNYPFWACSYNNITLNIGFGVTKIPSYAFCGTKLTGSIIIPGSVTSIGTKAFANNNGNYTNLTNVYMLGTTVPELADASVFQTGYSSYCSVKVFYSKDHSILTEYQEADNWSTLSSNISETNNFTVTNMDLTGIATPVTIPSGNTITVTGTATNSTAANLVIGDGGQLICNNSVAATVQKTTTASEEKTSNAWYAIASPVNNIAISSFALGTHNVYRYDEPTYCWQEYHNWGSTPATATLANGQGYLYRSTEANIVFTGSANVESGTYPLTYTDAAGNLKGFHLIGNPYTHNIYKGTNAAIESEYLEDGFYTLTTSGGWNPGTDNSTVINPAQGILVQAKSTVGEGKTLTITKTTNQGPSAAKAGNDQIMFKVENSEHSDVAYVLFKEGHGLNKIEHRNADIPMLYVINNDENFAIADMNNDTKAINLNFEAKTTGKYTLSYNAEGEFSYLHVIDRMTGEDVDMLLEEEYSFIGSPMDNPARFIVRLEYSSNSESSENSVFAYQNGNEIVVNGEGELQIFDVTGRKVMTTMVNGVETIDFNAQGVYIFKLNEKTQKIVVK